MVLAKLREDAANSKMSREQFCREYLGLSSNQRTPLFKDGHWQRVVADPDDFTEPAAGQGCVLGVDTSPDGTHSSIVGVWPGPTPKIMLLATGEGDVWLIEALTKLATAWWATTSPPTHAPPPRTSTHHSPHSDGPVSYTHLTLPTIYSV